MDGSGESSKRQREPLNPGATVPTVKMMRGRVIFGLALGVAGTLFGVASVLLSNQALAVTAGFCAVAACLVVGATSLSALFPKRAKRPSTLADAAGKVDIDNPVPIGGSTTEQSVIDPVTELPDARFFEVAVDGRVAAARRHLWPVSIVLVRLGFDATSSDEAEKSSALIAFAELMRQTLREADIACRLDESTFGLILEDTSEEGGVWTAERLQIALSHDSSPIRRLVAGVAAYPTHGLFAKDVLTRAQSALQRASTTPSGHGLGQVEVAHVDLS